MNLTGGYRNTSYGTVEENPAFYQRQGVWRIDGELYPGQCNQANGRDVGWPQLNQRRLSAGGDVPIARLSEDAYLASAACVVWGHPYSGEVLYTRGYWHLAAYLINNSSLYRLSKK